MLLFEDDDTDVCNTDVKDDGNIYQLLNDNNNHSLTLTQNEQRLEGINEASLKNQKLLNNSYVDQYMSRGFHQ